MRWRIIDSNNNISKPSPPTRWTWFQKMANWLELLFTDNKSYFHVSVPDPVIFPFHLFTFISFHFLFITLELSGWKRAAFTIR